MIKKIISALLIFSQTAYAGFPPTTIQGQSDATATTKFNFQVPNNQYTDLGGIKSLIETGNNNILKNAGFEASTYSTSWTITNSTGAVDTTNEVQGLQGAALTLSAQTGDIIRQSVAPSGNLDSQNFEASCRIKTSLTTVQLCGLVSNTEQNCQTVSSNNISGLVTTNFISTGGSATVGVKVKTTGTETGVIYVDDCYVGQARNIGSTSQAVLMGAVVINGCSGTWTTTSTTFVTPSVATGCVYTTSNNALAPTTMIPAIRFSTLPAGDYLLQYEGKTLQATSALNAQYQFSDGTNTAREISSFSSATTNTGSASISQSISYTAPQSNITLTLRLKTDTGGTASIFGTTAIPGTIKVWYFPNSAQQVFNAGQLPASWSGYHATDCAWNRNSTTYNSYAEDNSCTFTEKTNRNFGSVTSPIVSTGRIPRITFTPNRAGMYEVCASFQAYNSATSNATGYKMVDASSNELLTKINYTAVAGNPNILQMCTIVNIPNTSPYTVNIQGQAAGVSTNYINFTGTAPTDWSIISLDNQFPSPVLVGSVTTNASSALRVVLFSATVSGAGVCTINSNPYSDISTCTESGQAGVATFSKPFSAAPICFSNKTLSTSAYFTGVNTSTASTVTFASWQTTSATVYSSNPVNVMCIGAR